MKAQKDTSTGKWKIQYRYTTWDEKVQKSTKRGFQTKREAEEWLREFLQTKQADLNMRFEEFSKLYYADMETRLREHTMKTKRYIVDLKILPYFKDKKMNDIKLLLASVFGEILANNFPYIFSEYLPIFLTLKY